MRLAGDLHKKFRNFFPQFSVFFKGLRLRKMGFLLFPVGEELFSRFMGIPSGFFGAVKLMKFQQYVLLPLALRMTLLIWVSSKVRNFLRKCLRSTASPLCKIMKN